MNNTWSVTVLFQNYLNCCAFIVVVGVLVNLDCLIFLYIQHLVCFFILQPGSHWNDGPCRSCTCEKTAAGGPHPVCTVQACFDLLTEQETTNYEVEKVPVPNQCCPSIVRIACKDGNTVYKVYISSLPFNIFIVMLCLNTGVTPQLFNCM